MSVERTLPVYEYYLRALKVGSVFYFAGDFYRFNSVNRGIYRVTRSFNGRVFYFSGSSLVIAPLANFKVSELVEVRGKRLDYPWSLVRRFPRLRSADPCLF